MINRILNLMMLQFEQASLLVLLFLEDLHWRPFSRYAVLSSR